MTRGLSFASPLPVSDFCVVFGFEVFAGEVDLEVGFGVAMGKVTVRSRESESACKADKASRSRKKGFSESRMEGVSSSLGSGLCGCGAESNFGIVAGAGAAGMAAPATTGTTGGTIVVSFMAFARSIAVSGFFASI